MGISMGSAGFRTLGIPQKEKINIFLNMTAAAVEPQEAAPALAEASPAAAEHPANVECIEVTFDRCSALGITEMLVERAARAGRREADPARALA